MSSLITSLEANGTSASVEWLDTRAQHGTVPVEVADLTPRCEKTATRRVAVAACTPDVAAQRPGPVRPGAAHSQRRRLPRRARRGVRPGLEAGGHGPGQAKADGSGTLGQFINYDAMVNQRPRDRPRELRRDPGCGHAPRGDPGPARFPGALPERVPRRPPHRDEGRRLLGRHDRPQRPRATRLPAPAQPWAALARGVVHLRRHLPDRPLASRGVIAPLGGDRGPRR